jgi:hypothetical protein
MKPTLQRSHAWPVLVDDCRRFFTELEKSSGFWSVLVTLAGTPALIRGEADEVRFGGIVLYARPDVAVGSMEEAVDRGDSPP